MVSCKDRYTDRDTEVEGFMMILQNPYCLINGKVIKVKRENYNTVSVWIRSDIKPENGQYVIFYGFGRGEAPITVASYNDGISLHTIRIVGDVTGYFNRISEGDDIYLRGPYGNSWDLMEFEGRQIIIISGGLGIAATRWLMEEAIQNRDRFKEVISLYGVKSVDDLLYREEYENWSSKIRFSVIVQNPSEAWSKDVGLITDLIEKVKIDKDCGVFICGPDPMVKAVVNQLYNIGVDKSNIKVSLERHMKCSVGTCGHCMFGPFFVCKDGPVFRFSDIDHFFDKKGV